MIRLLFNDGEILIPSEYKMSAPICTIIAPSNPNVTGFKLEKDGVVTFDYTKFHTLYRKLDNGYQLSNDGSIYVEPIPPQPVHSTLIADGNEFDVVDFNNNTFKIEMPVSEAQETFADVTEYTVNGIPYKYLTFGYAVEYDSDYSLVVFSQKTETDFRLDSIEESLTVYDEAIADLSTVVSDECETISELSVSVSDNEEAIADLSEVVSELME